MIRETLKKLWITDDEINVYSELLYHWDSTATFLSEQLNMEKKDVSYTCELLIKNKLITSKKMGDRIVYMPESPSAILDILEKKKRQWEEDELYIKKSISFFNRIRKERLALPKVTFYEWIDGIKELYNQILDLWMPIEAFEDNGNMSQCLWWFVDYFVEERKNRGIYSSVICSNKNAVNTNSWEELRWVKQIDNEKFPFSCDIKICGEFVNIISFKWDNSVAISIKDSDIAKNFRILFKYMWEELG